MVNAKTWNPAQIDQAIRRLEGIIRSGSYNPAVLNQLLNQLGEPGYINTWNPAELDQKLRTLLHDLLSWKTATGNPIQLRTNNGGLVQSCEITMNPIQSGSGDPSPTNIRPISGRDALHLYIDTEQTETPETTHTATFPDTVCGGSYDFVSGEGQSTFKKFTLGDKVWTKANTQSGKWRFVCSTILNDAKTPKSTAKIGNYCSTYKEVTADQTWTGTTGIALNPNGQLLICDLIVEDVEDLMTIIADQEYCYELATPTEITLTAEQIELLKGQNVLWTDGDSIEITYKKLLLPSDVEELSKNKKIKEKPKTTRSKKKKEE